MGQGNTSSYYIYNINYNSNYSTYSFNKKNK